jgi:hypothetical protein
MRGVRLLLRENPISAAGKVIRYARWRIPAEIKRHRVLKLDTSQERFTAIYNSNLWGAVDTVSGPAASLENTEALRRHLPAIFEKYAVRTLFDVPCGDFHWMKHVVAEYPMTYIGGDIVLPMIEANNARYGNARTSFIHFDAARDQLPQADLYLCRGLLSLLSFADGMNALRRFAESKIPYILASTHKTNFGVANIDIKSGDFRRIDMFSAPFSLPQEIERLSDSNDEDVCVWSREQVALALKSAG